MERSWLGAGETTRFFALALVIIRFVAHRIFRFVQKYRPDFGIIFQFSILLLPYYTNNETNREFYTVNIHTEKNVIQCV